MNIKNIIALCLVGSIVGTRQIIEAARAQEELIIRRSYKEPKSEKKALVINDFQNYWNSSDRKGKGQKKREASARRKRGW